MARLINISAVAENTFPIEECTEASKPRWIGENTDRFARFRNKDRNPFLNWKTMGKVLIRTWRLRNVVLDAATMLISKDGYIVKESNYQRSALEIDNLSIDCKKLIKIDSPVPVLIAGDAWSSNHYHWLNHTLPAIYSSMSLNGIDGFCIASLPIRPVHERTLTLIGCADTPRLVLKAGSQYFFKEIEFCHYTVGAADFANSPLIQSIHNKISDLVPKIGFRPRGIYVSRIGATHRKIANEAVLISKLQKRGFKIVDAAAMTLDEQVRTFRGATFVVAPHGAGLANISFCRKETQVYELLPRGFPVPCNLVLSIRGKSSFWADAFDSTGNGPQFLQDWKLDVPAVLERIDEIEGTGWLNRVKQIRDRFQNALCWQLW